MKAIRNLPFWLWYGRFWGMDVDAAANRSFYGIMGPPMNGSDGCEFAQYDYYRLPSGPGLSPVWSAKQPSEELGEFAAHTDYAIAAEPFAFGWTFDNGWPPKTNVIVNNVSVPAPVVGGRPTNAGLMGDLASNDQGAAPTFTVSGRFLIAHAGSNSATYDSPALYGVPPQASEANGPYALPDHQKPHLYVPPASWTMPIDPATCYTAFEAFPGPFQVVDTACARDDMYNADFVPPRTVTCDAREESIVEAGARHARYLVDSIIHVPGYNPARFRPTIPLKGAKIAAGVYATEDFVRRVLGLTRSAGANSATVYDHRFIASANGGWPSPSDWADTERVINEVFNLKITDYAVVNGTFNPNGEEIDALNRILPELGQPKTVTLTSDLIAGNYVTAISVELTGDRLAPGQNGTVRVILEGEASRLHVAGQPTGSVPNCGEAGSDTDRRHLKDIRGKIYAFNWNTLLWDQLLIQDFSDGSYGLFAPLESRRPGEPVVNPPVWNDTYRSQRRTYQFDAVLLPKYVKTVTVNGVVEYRMDVKLVQTGAAPFQTTFDLVQVLYSNLALPAVGEIPGPTEGSMMAGGGGGVGGPTTSDYNYDNAATPADMEAFLLDFVNSDPAADLNNDAVIDLADVEAILVGG